MRCQNCGHDRLKVLETRQTSGGQITRRRVECEACGHRDATYELPAPAFRSARYDVDRWLQRQANVGHLRERQALKQRMLAERLSGASCRELAKRYGLSVHMARYYTRQPREALYPAAKARVAS